MQSLLQSLGVFFLFLIAMFLLLVIGIAIFIALVIKSVLSSNVIYQTGQNYADDTIKAIANNWNLEEIKRRVIPKMLDSEDLAQWHNYCLECQENLGKLTNYRGSQGSLQGLPIFKDLKPLMRFTVKKSDLETLEASEKIILGEYIALADFEKGVAKFEIQILKQNEEWLINSLIITLNNSNFSDTTEFTFGQKTTIQTLVEDNKKRLKLEKLL